MTTVRKYGPDSMRCKSCGGQPQRIICSCGSCGRCGRYAVVRRSYCDFCGERDACYEDDLPVRPESRRGVIYFLRARGSAHVKVGFTSQSVERRMASLRTGSPVELDLERAVAGTIAEERDLHRRLAPKRVAREWFALTEDEVARLEIGDR